jgi:hypothetical protein
MRSMKFWYASNATQHSTTIGRNVVGLHFKSALMSFSLLASSSFLKSFVFCARSFLCVSVSRWYATMSDATLSSCGTRVVRSMAGAWLACCCPGCADVSYFSTRRWPSGTCSRRPQRRAPRPHASQCPARPRTSSSPPRLRPPCLLLG